MKTLRYRIRVITLILVSAILAVLLCCIRDTWLLSSPVPDTVVSSPVPESSESPLSPGLTPVPKGTAVPEVSPSPELSASPEPADSPVQPFETFGL